MDKIKNLFMSDGKISKTKIISWVAMFYGGYNGAFSPDMVEGVKDAAMEGMRSWGTMWAGATSLFMRMGIDKR